MTLQGDCLMRPCVAIKDGQQVLIKVVLPDQRPI